MARKKLMEGVKEGYQDDILNIMLQYEKKNSNYEIEQQVDDFMTFFIAGLLPCMLLANSLDTELSFPRNSCRNVDSGLKLTTE